MQWYKEADGKSRAMARDYLDKGFFESFNRCCIKRLYASPAGLVIVPMQDIIGLGKNARMNVPSTVGGNWSWRMQNGELTSKRASFLRELSEKYFR